MQQSILDELPFTYITYHTAVPDNTVQNTCDREMFHINTKCTIPPNISEKPNGLVWKYLHFPTEIKDSLNEENHLYKTPTAN